MKPEEDKEYRQASELVLTAVALFALLQSATRNPMAVEQADQLAVRAAHLGKLAARSLLKKTPPEST
jgi:hypothetical protein